MRKLVMIAVAAAGLGTFVLAMHSTFAEDLQPKAKAFKYWDIYESNITSVPAGEYKPLTLWSTITLGSSYYTNPQRAQTINVAYSYGGTEFSNEGKSHALWNLANQGTIAFGMIDKLKMTINVVPLETLQKSFSVTGPSELAKVLARDDVLVVTSNKILLGETSNATVVKTVSSPKPQ